MLIHPSNQVDSDRSLWSDESGAELIEKLVMIALFIFVAVVGLRSLGDKVEAKFESQGNAIEQAEDTLPAK